MKYLVCGISMAFFMLVGCAPVIKNLNFDDKNKLHNKRVGIFFDSHLVGEVQGVDEYTLNEYLPLFYKTMCKNSSNLKFLNFTNSKLDTSTYKIFKDTIPGHFFKDAKDFEFKIPDKNQLGTLLDSIDLLFIIEDLSFSGAAKASKWSNEGGYNPNAGIPVAPGVGISINLPSESTGAYEQTTYLEYVLWDYKTDKPLNFNFGQYKKKIKFGTEIPLEQEANELSNDILRKLHKENTIKSK